MSADGGTASAGPAGPDPAFALLGAPWTAALVHRLGAGAAGFSQLRHDLAVSDSVLSRRLSELGRARLLRRTVEPGPPVRVSYALTRAGHALLPVLADLHDWGREHLTHPRTETP